MSKKIFDFCIGNPPFNKSNLNTSDDPIYDRFIEASIKIADKVELITPARFLFNAGKTKKNWNEKMLNNSHFKVLKYFNNGKDVFPNTDIKGGIAIHYYDYRKIFDPIIVFSAHKELNEIIQKYNKSFTSNSLKSIFFSSDSYKLSNDFHKSFPQFKYNPAKKENIFSKGHDNLLSSNFFEKVKSPTIYMEPPKDGNEYFCIIGRLNGKRTKRWIKCNYLEAHPSLNKFKIMLPEANGRGDFGETITDPFVAHPGECHTQTFVSIGAFDSENEANNALKYIKGKFSRAMLSILKITQHTRASTWTFVPLQDFTDHSDIDWSKSIPEIDQQLYRKYDLSDEEIDFIETHVKEMK